ncbi:MAG: MarR family transcriptional regulator [Acidobacteriota bacterium]
MEARDLIDRLQSEWHAERPELDTAAMGVVGRLMILGDLLKKQAGDALAPFGLGYTDLDVLATLRRSGPPYRLRPADLLRSVLIQSGSLTACLDRLQKRGWVERVETPDDRRSRSVQLTDDGRELVDRAIEARFRLADAQVASLSAEDRDALERLLRQLLLDQT